MKALALNMDIIDHYFVCWFGKKKFEKRSHIVLPSFKHICSWGQPRTLNLLLFPLVLWWRHSLLNPVHVVLDFTHARKYTASWAHKSKLLCPYICIIWRRVFLQKWFRNNHPSFQSFLYRQITSWPRNQETYTDSDW